MTWWFFCCLFAKVGHAWWTFKSYTVEQFTFASNESELQQQRQRSIKFIIMRPVRQLTCMIVYPLICHSNQLLCIYVTRRLIISTVQKLFCGRLLLVKVESNKTVFSVLSSPYRISHLVSYRTYQKLNLIKQIFNYDQKSHGCAATGKRKPQFLREN